MEIRQNARILNAANFDQKPKKAKEKKKEKEKEKEKESIEADKPPARDGWV